MKRKIFIMGFGLLLGVLGGYSQELKTVEGEELREILEEIRRVSAGIETFECVFVQNKQIAILEETAVSEGRMYYRKPDYMRWEYLHPQAYYFVVNKGKSVMKRGDVTDRNGARIFGEIGKMILTCMRGEKLVDEEKFIPEYTRNKDLFRICLKPGNRRLQQIMDVLILEFSIRVHTIEFVEMRQGDDVTRIEFQDKKINKGVNDLLFQWKE